MQLKSIIYFRRVIMHLNRT